MPKSKTDFTNFVDARPNYFPGQFLLEDDFNVEQKYLIDRQKYHRQSLHVSGIVEGLEVEVITNKLEVQIKSGSAINSNGDLIILKKDTSFSQFAALTNGELYIRYNEKKEVEQQGDFTRWQEVPTIGFAATTPNDGVKLAKISIVSNSPNLDLKVRDYSGIFLPNATGNDLTLRSGGEENPNVAILNGSLTVTGTFKVNNKIAVLGNQKIEFSDDGITNNLKLQLRTGYGLGINSGTLFYAANGNHSWRDSSGVERMALTTESHGSLTVKGTGTSSFAGNLTVTGNVGIGTTNPTTKLEVSGNLKVTGTITGKIDATSIDSGTLTVDRIPNLPAEKIAAGTTKGDLTIGGKLTVPGNQKIKFSDTDTTNNLKLELWTGYGLGINSGTLFYAANGNHSWRDHNGTNEIMALTTAGNLKVNGAITPSAGVSKNNGIMFPEDPFGGTGDAAWIRYYSRNPQNAASKEHTTFEIGTSNDADDHIALMPGAGNVGIGTITPTTKLEVNGNLKVTGNITTESWQTPSLLNGWRNYDNVYNPPGYFKDSFGIVHLRGLVTNGAGTIFTLPLGYRPAFRELQAVVTWNNTIGRLDIQTNGEVLMNMGNNAWFSLDGVTFRAA
ncbi:hypothetical protein [Dolichospermum flos-aquae]|uniref:Uncharacterized protein n=1 Tax=Dolichospermum flos-aquae LEGE 04289 TaxID=1828708 RepID=A0ACC5PY52_DOLFA|nr:hypothetical protein [Dolichospermum flos-aquae]MBE9217559.1 hypothetical protein [Dolichospermum flos-aquae LEGE 04289]